MILSLLKLVFGRTKSPLGLFFLYIYYSSRRKQSLLWKGGKLYDLIHYFADYGNRHRSSYPHHHGCVWWGISGGVWRLNRIFAHYVGDHQTYQIYQKEKVSSTTGLLFFAFPIFAPKTWRIMRRLDLAQMVEQQKFCRSWVRFPQSQLLLAFTIFRGVERNERLFKT